MVNRTVRQKNGPEKKRKKGKREGEKDEKKKGKGQKEIRIMTSTLVDELKSDL